MYLTRKKTRYDGNINIDGDTDINASSIHDVEVLVQMLTIISETINKLANLQN